ncbi:lytic transglycosylase domain-containing protein [Plantibacter sp. YIM 135249]|uniref:lytic transglycosylase domain-containing protein n=1 Tax=Plantibacter sp. YIM 135249 TaxID=3423918 RepID=UPI003D329467
MANRTAAGTPGRRKSTAASGSRSGSASASASPSRKRPVAAKRAADTTKRSAAAAAKGRTVSAKRRPASAAPKPHRASRPRRSPRVRRWPRTARSRPKSSRGPARGALHGKRWLIIGGIVCVVAIAVVVGVLLAVPAFLERTHPAEATVQLAPHAAPDGPGLAAVPRPGGPPAGIADRVDSTWAQQTAARTGIPLRALRSYAGASLAIAESRPECGIGWNTIAAIGRVESVHGTIDGGAINDAGVTVPPIIGPALTGQAFDAIADTDGGKLDGDARWDRAVGPMQFIPSSWKIWGVDGNGDGIADPQNLDDAALSTAGYLCDAGGQLQDEGNWVNAIRSYNGADSYLHKVADAANEYAGR